MQSFYKFYFHFRFFRDLSGIKWNIAHIFFIKRQKLESSKLWRVLNGNGFNIWCLSRRLTRFSQKIFLITLKQNFRSLQCKVYNSSSHLKCLHDKLLRKLLTKFYYLRIDLRENGKILRINSKCKKKKLKLTNMNLEIAE